MTTRLLVLAVASTALCACTQGQKGRTELKTEMDTVSYAIGADIGGNFRMNKLEGINVDALRDGLRDGLDSSLAMDEETMGAVVQGYMQRMQEEMRAEEERKGEENLAKGRAFLATNAERKQVKTTASGLQYEVIAEGKGAMPTVDDQVRVHYTGTLIDGTEFDSSVGRGQPAVFGVGQVIPGWVEGLQLMSEGAKYKFYIPSDLAYGPGGAPGGAIPPNSTLIFDVELLEVIK
ncbi:MAG: FKBP-type peptidyl-prolyl cis-trans isomerase [Flavobacteriales bacterium]|jgi:FKBP-type peptidyl-prolyl cis-trans isomerase FklB|nr:FKBP-type peptidyl-prolyl cis-trans isomerase [Flavobacteriales bacterium]